MIADIDIWRTAHLLISQHGEDAALVAGRRVDHMIESGDPKGELVWKRVLAAVKDLQRTKPAADESVN